MTLLVFGKTGQVATELARLSGRGGLELICLSRAEADLSDPAACAAAIATHTPSAVINAAAWTQVDGAETDEPAARVVNADAPAAMAQACAGMGIPLVHISTDYVFDGTGDSPWTTSDPVAPQNAYGRTKLAGEDAVRTAGGPHAVLRTAWVFSAHGANFVKTMLRLAETRDQLRVVSDQIGGPTPARAIAEACHEIALTLIRDPGKSGTYHFSGGPDISWAGFARAIFAATGAQVEVADIPSSDYPTPAPRPLNSRLDCSATQQAFGIARPDWATGLRDVLSDLRAI
ncbi:dTDP-4-dehydrorhamnose reductase [Puniceibacterium sp. IMCC21224]|uniref:dTDP-4-dehydrorhamnose reductase n=1 Tax=Puniceibacterium sp. IMCC21224 TaxID=1618204 RepID=UPI00064DDFFC|nr:dTDP-4-dehydrorhamnose reductase [Puniceibacterium sp. IMCC21224]KMK63949.1 dTDP-4-dehydrorhamnose reductase [Puniceibacterium sp. IMCC21224]